MSVRIMSAIWDMDFSPVEKLILLAVADWANDDGVAWPSIAKLAKKTGCGERTVQRTLRAAEKSGLITRHENPGKGCSYRIDPRHTGTPATQAPVPESAPTPATLAPNTLGNTSSQKTSSSSKARASKSDDFPKPDWADPQVWDDWLKVRKAKGATNTATAHKGFLEDIARYADAEWPPGRILEHAVRKNWRGIYDPREQDTRNGHRNTAIALAGNRTRPEGRLGGRTIGAAKRFAARE